MAGEGIEGTTNVEHFEIIRQNDKKLAEANGTVKKTIYACDWLMRLRRDE